MGNQKTKATALVQAAATIVGSRVAPPVGTSVSTTHGVALAPSLALDIDAYESAVRTELEAMGLSEPWSMLLVDRAAGPLADFHKRLVCTAEAARSVFRPEKEKTEDDYLQMVTELIEFYGNVDPGKSQATAERCKLAIASFFAKGVDEHSVAKQLCADSGLAKCRPDLPPAPPTVDVVGTLLDQAVAVGLWGTNRAEVTEALLRRGLETLVRDGLLMLPKPTAG